MQFLSPEDVASIRKLPTSELSEVRSVKTEIFEIDGTTIHSDRDLFSAMSVVMRCPYTIAHWGGMREFLLSLERPSSDIDVSLDADGQRYSYVLIVRSARPFWQDAPLVVGEFITMWLFCAEQLSHDSVAFHLVFEI